MRIPANHPALPGHFPGHPVVPGVMLLTAVVEAVAGHVGRPVRVSGFPQVKFLAPLTPGQDCEVSLSGQQPGKAGFEIRSGTERLVTGTVAYVETM